MVITYVADAPFLEIVGDNLWRSSNFSLADKRVIYK